MAIEKILNESLFTQFFINKEKKKVTVTVRTN